MIMQSGVLPYEYAGRLPLRSTPEYPIGYSGVLVEQAMWALNAERRRYRGELDNGQFEWKSYLFDGTSSIFEPTVSGQYLANSGVPVIITPIDYILALRRQFWEHFLEDGFAEDSDYLPEQFRRDWIHNAYTSSPSGRKENILSDGDGNYFRGNPPALGQQLSTDIGILGTSGILFDLDYGEVFYQPYPRIGRTLFGDGRGLTHKFIGAPTDVMPIPLSPAFPCFQSTSGSLVSTTARDIRAGQSRYYQVSTTIFGQAVFDSLHVGSGTFRLDGDVLLPSSTYYLGRGGHNAKEDFFPVATFGFAVSGLRPIGRPRHLNFGNSGDIDTKIPSGQNSPFARVFLRPPGSNESLISSGIYHILVANRRFENPDSAVSSGVISHWPSGNANRICPGYQVFNDCFWIRDPANADTNGASSSGVTVISPFLGTFLWTRFADETNISLAGNLSVPQTSLAFARLNYAGLVGFARNGLNSVKLIYPVASASSIDSTLSANQIKLYIGNYDDLLTLLSTSESAVLDTSTPGFRFLFPPYHDFMFDGTDYWISQRDAPAIADDPTAQFDASFNLVKSYHESPFLGSHIRRLVFFNSKYRAYSQDSISEGNVGALSERTFNVSTGLFTAGTIKVITATNLPPFDGTSILTNTLEVFHCTVITNGIHVNNGLWATIRTSDDDSGGEIAGSTRYWLVRLTEGATTFTIVEFYQIATFGDIVHMSINPGVA